MSTTGPTQDVFDLVLARPVVTEAGEHSTMVHLWWLAPTQSNQLVQIYLDDELVEVSVDPAQRELWLLSDRSESHRIELLAVPGDDPDQLWRSRPDLLGSWNPPAQSSASVTLIRNEQLPVDTQVTISVDGKVMDRGALWSADESRSGFGALFGLDGFGHDAIAGPGLGRGELGMGPLGTDGTAWRWKRRDLATGIHDLTATATDGGGQTVANPVMVEDIFIDRLPGAAATFTMAADFTLTWTS